MKITVNLDACKLHGQCTIAAPDIFAFNEKGELVWNATPDESLFDDAEAAADAYPEQAIVVEP